MAEYILGQAAIVAKGAYANETAYLPLNSVSYCGGSWICKKNCSGVAPGTSSGWEEYWMSAAVGIKSMSITSTGEGTASVSITFSDGTESSFEYNTSAIADGTITTGKLTSGFVLPVAKGGTGATAAAAARTSLGAQQTHTTTTASLPASGWSNKTRSVSVTGVTASNTVFCSPAAASWAVYNDCGVRCSAQGSGTLTFTCEDVPASTLTVNVVIFNK